MNVIYLVYPKNKNLKHCPDSFQEALMSTEMVKNDNIVGLDKFDVLTVINLWRKNLRNDAGSRKNSAGRVIVFLFATQPEYVFAIILFRFMGLLTKSQFEVYHQMHEPKYEKARSKLQASVLQTSVILYTIHLIMSKLSNMTLLSSREAVGKADFIKKEKIVQINLTFIANDVNFLNRNLEDLKYSWQKSKTFSLIGIAAKDKNPQGFLSFANIANSQYSGQVKFIRAGRDKDITLDYESENIIPFSGYINNFAKEFLLSLTHIVIFPYSFSTQSGALAEALSYGKLIIANDIPAFSHLKGLKFTYIINFNDTDAILHCLKQIFAMSEEDYEQSYWKAIEYFNKHHSPLYLQGKLYELLQISPDK